MVDNIIVFILQIRKLRFQGPSKMAKDHTSRNAQWGSQPRAAELRA